MRHAAAGAVLLTLLSASVHAETVTIDQSAWLNYAIVVTTMKKESDLRIEQRGTVNGISSVQMSGESNAEIQTRQRGRRNAAVVHQSGWITASRIVQEGPGRFSGSTDLPMQYSRQYTDDGYLTYFTTGGFNLITLTDSNHTWISRFGRAR